MASSKKIGFFWGEGKLTLVEFEKNAPLKIISSLLASKTNSSSPFSSDFTEEIQISAVFQRMLQENSISGASFHISLPVKEFILRSFVIHQVSNEDLPNAVKFEAKKYLPIDVQDLTYAYHKIPFVENNIKRFQIIFFAVRKEFIERYERVFKQVNATISYCEPCMVSLSKVLLFKKEISPTDQIAYLILDQNLGRICFIDQGIPQFIRDFFINPQVSPEGVPESKEAFTQKIINEVANSFDFYSRQFSSEKITQLLFSGIDDAQYLVSALESELKIKIKQALPIATTDIEGKKAEMEAVFAMGSCIEPTLGPLAEFNFIGTKIVNIPLDVQIGEFIKAYKEALTIVAFSALLLGAFYFLSQLHLKSIQTRYESLNAQLGASKDLSTETITADFQKNSDELNNYKNIRSRSEVVSVLVKVAAYLPQGAKLKTLTVNYDQGDLNTADVVVDMNGEVFKDDPSDEIKLANKIFSDFKNDKELTKFFKKVDVSINLVESAGHQVTAFNIHCT